MVGSLQRQILGEEPAANLVRESLAKRRSGTALPGIVDGGALAHRAGANHDQVIPFHSSVLGCQ
jgi:hypothetical protein